MKFEQSVRLRLAHLGLSGMSAMETLGARFLYCVYLCQPLAELLFHHDQTSLHYTAGVLYLY